MYRLKSIDYDDCLLPRYIINKICTAKQEAHQRANKRSSGEQGLLELPELCLKRLVDEKHARGNK